MSKTETHHFQAEIQQLLDIVIHSLYTDKEIFVRELISNAADACEKLRFNQSSGTTVHQSDIAPAITVTTDDKAGTITITDTGCGMTHGELVENLGTIAHSGTKAFLKQLAEEKKPDVGLIGQFGVGFYSAFMVAKKVTRLQPLLRTGGAGLAMDERRHGRLRICSRRRSAARHQDHAGTQGRRQGFFARTARSSASSSAIPVSCRSRLN